MRNESQVRHSSIPENKGQQSTESIELPFVTVIMPVRNEEQYIADSLEAVLLQDYPHEMMEVLIADGMSDDNTRELIRKISNNHQISVRILDNTKQIVSAGMNLAIGKAKGDITLRVDGHAIIQTDYLSQCVEYLIHNDVDCAGGPLDSVGKGYVGEAVAFVMSSKFGVGGTVFRTASNRNRPIRAETVPFGAYRKDVFERVGLFNEEMVRHQDYELCYRLRKNGGKIMLLPKVRAKYFVRSTVKTFVRQYWQYGIWKGRFIRKYPDSLKLRHMIPPVFVIILLLSGTISFFSGYAFFIYSATIGSYIAFVIAALLSFSVKLKFKYLPVLPVLLACMHLSWGAGFWKGLFMKKLT